MNPLWRTILMVLLTAAFSVVMGKALDAMPVAIWVKYTILSFLFLGACLVLFGVVGVEPS